MIVLILCFSWTKKVKFPSLKDGLPKDFADEIERYEFLGFSKNKYIFYKKDGKYGIIDVTHYCVKVPAQYDSISWRIPNMVYDITIGDKKETIKIINS